MLHARRLMANVLRPAHLRRTGAIALVVGTWLTLLNQGDVILDGTVSWGLLIKVALNYLTPFVVANFGLLSRETEKTEHGGEHGDNYPGRRPRDLP